MCGRLGMGSLVGPMLSELRYLYIHVCGHGTVRVRGFKFEGRRREWSTDRSHQPWLVLKPPPNQRGVHVTPVRTPRRERGSGLAVGPKRTAFTRSQKRQAGSEITNTSSQAIDQK